MKLTGFADEAARDLATQIKVTKELAWDYISARGINGKNIHELGEEEFASAVALLEENEIKIAEFGSLIGSWSKPISTDFAITLAEVERAIPRMQRLGTQIVRVMSYAQEPWGGEQYVAERIKRLNEVTKRFTDAGLTVAHENCMNYGGFSAEHTLELIEAVPHLKLIFDTGNPVFQLDRSKQQPDGTFPWQDALAFYTAVKEHIVHIHIKDCLNPKAEGQEPEYVYPGEGQGYVKEILADLKANHYDGFIAIEPHLATVFHLTDGAEPDWEKCYDSYLTYGMQLNALIALPAS